MVKNYKGINDDLRVVLNLARQKAIMDSRNVASERDPVAVLTRVNSQIDAINRLDDAIKS